MILMSSRTGSYFVEWPSFKLLGILSWLYGDLHDYMGRITQKWFALSIASLYGDMMSKCIASVVNLEDLVTVVYSRFNFSKVTVLFFFFLIIPPHHFWHILFVRDKSLGSASTYKGRKWRHGVIEIGLIGAISEAAHHTLKGKVRAQW